MRSAPAVKHQHQLLSWCLWASVGAALWQLPDAELPWPWLMALMLPAALLALLQLRPGPQRWRVVLVVLLQVGLGWAAVESGQRLGRPAALAGTILWPLAFVAVRRRDADVPLALFLSFCVLLVGIILRGPETGPVAAYAVAAAMVLRAEARLAALRAASALRPAGNHSGRQLLSGGSLALWCGVAVLALLRAQELLPAAAELGPDRTAAAPAPAPRRSIGLSDRFDLGGGGMFTDLRGEQLVKVTASDGPVPDDLYLRTGFFDIPGLDNWHVSSFQAELRDTTQRTWQVRRPLPQAPLRRLDVERFGPGRELVFVPAGICSLQGLDELHGSLRHEWFRQAPGSGGAGYRVSFQDLRPLLAGQVPDERWRQQGLTRLADDFDRRLFLPLVRQAAGTELDPVAVADAIGELLGRRCRYTLLEPEGPYGHALLDFLFSCHAGYCMHFASAAAILLRMCDIPCRIGVGLYGGEGAGPEQRVYGSQHAHAWVEIPYQGLGWVVFDPTPAGQRGQRLPQADRQPAPADPGSEADGPDLRQRLGAFLAQPLPWLLLLALAMLSTLLPTRRRRQPAAAAMPAAVRPARRLLLRLLAELGRRGLPRRPGQTLEDFAAVLQQRCGAQPQLQQAFASYQEVRFGARPFDQDRQAALQRGIAAAQQLQAEGVSGS